MEEPKQSSEQEEGKAPVQLALQEAEPKLARIQANRKAAAALLDEQARQDALDEQLRQSESVLIAQCGHLLDTGLSTSRLPEVIQKRIRKQFEGKAFEATILKTVIEEAREELSELTAGNMVTGPAARLACSIPPINCKRRWKTCWK